MKERTRILLALVAALVLGVLIGMSGNPALLGVADALAPIGTVWVNAIRMTVFPLVLSLMVTSIASAASLKSVGRLGGRTVGVFLTLVGGMAVVMIPVQTFVFSLLSPPGTRPALPAGAVEAAKQVAASQPQTFSSWIISLVPANPVAAAANGSTMSFIIFAVIFAIAVANIQPEPRATLLSFFRALGDAMLMIVRWVILAAPIGVFALALPLTAHVGAGIAGAIGFYIIAYSGGCIVGMILLTLVVPALSGMTPGQFARGALPPQLIALTSSSSLATLPALVASADENLKLPRRIADFVLPLAVSTFKVAAPVSWTTGVLFIGWFYGVHITMPQLLTLALATVVFQFGTPGIPRGAFIMLAPLLSSFGLPAEGIGLLIAVDVIPDAFATALNVTGDLAAAAIVAHRERRGETGDSGTASA